MATDLQSVLSQLLTGATTALDPNQIKASLAPITDMVKQTGGLDAVLDKLKAGGLNEQVNSWLGQGANLAASPDQIMAALGPDNLKAAAEQAGTTATELATQLSQALPVLVDKLSPAGSLPGVAAVSDLVSKLPGGQQLTGLFSGLLGGGSSDATPGA